MMYEAFIVHLEVSSLVKVEQALRNYIGKGFAGEAGSVEHMELSNFANEIRSRLQHIQNGYKPSGDFDPAGVESMFTPEALKLADVGVLDAALSYLVSRRQAPVEDWLA